VQRQAGQGTTAARLDLRRVSEMLLAPLDSAVVGIGPFESHGDMRLTNLGSSTATVTARLTYPPDPTYSFTIPAGESAVIPMHDAGSLSPIMALFVRNTAAQGAPIDLALEETYGFGLALGNGAALEVPSSFSAVLLRDDDVIDETLTYTVTGEDLVSGSTVSVTVSGPSALTGVPDAGGREPSAPAPAAAAPAIARLLAAPNPFADATTFSFDLARPATVELSVYDATGRIIRRLPAGTLAAGARRLAWDGRDDDGRAVSSGVYFLRADAPGERSATARVVRLAR
jgi:hypothetical protein